MIISHIVGGLGNQMFQYAVARALSKQLDTPLLLDVSSFSKYHLHNGFELARIFNLEAAVATKRDLDQVVGWQANLLVKRLLLRPEFSWLRSKSLVVEPHFQYWDGLKLVSKSAYLTGYWQSEKYFKPIESLIREDFIFKRPMSSENQRIADEIAQCNAVSLHIRRGDYVQNATTLSIHGVCSLDYYRAAIQYITERVIQPKFFIFSDDIAWVMDSLSVGYPYQYVDINHAVESYNDMRLMSLCQHNIIANSSFSWWGAWLNSNPEKVVIAPKRWFAVDRDISDLLPMEWVSI